MAGPLITFLTDFGPESAPAVCRGVMWGIAPDARILDLSHTVRKFAIRDGAFWVDTIGEHSAAGIAGNALVRIADGGTWNSVNALQVGVASQAKFVVAGGGSASFTGFAHIGELPQQVSAFAAPDQVHVHGAGSQLAINPAGDGG